MCCSTRSVAIDPKGVVGEPEYEVGAALRNPYEYPALFTDPAPIERRVDRFTRKPHLNRDRILTWAFAQAVLMTSGARSFYSTGTQELLGGYIQTLLLLGRTHLA